MILGLALAGTAAAHPDDGSNDGHEHAVQESDRDPSAPLAEHDAATSGSVSEGPSGNRTKNLDLVGRGERLVENATTDVWALDGFGYVGTFNVPCGDGTGSLEGPGVQVFNVQNPKKTEYVTTIPSQDGSRINDVKAANLNSGAILVHSNERCASHGPGGFEVYDVADPTNPVHLASVQVDDANEVLRETFGVVDVIFGWMRTGFGNSQNKYLHDITITDDGTKAYLSHWDAGLILLDISDPADPQLVSVAIDPENGSLDGEVNSHSAWPSADGSIVVEGEEDFSAWVGDTPPGNLTFGEGDPTTPLPGTAVGTNVGNDFEGSPTGNSGTVDAGSVEVTSGPLAGTTYPAIELAGDQPKFADVGPLSGEFVFIGRACNGDEILNADAIDEGDIAVVRRGACTFRQKNFNAADAGAAAVVIANNAEDSPWSGLRIWDYSDPENPVLASTFNTVCSASPTPIPECDPAGTYSVHNVVVENTDDGRVKAYVSWYYDGMLVLDVTDPANPVEVARFFDNSDEFLESNGGQPHDFWGVWKEPGEPWIYGSDRNGGLYVFKEKGTGSGRN